MNILVTGGGSEEPIDTVRAICNFSTGRTAAFLADYFASEGHTVTAIMAQKATMPKNSNVKIETYKTFNQLKETLHKDCGSQNFDAIIHAAAVSDYSPDTIEVDGKIFKAGQLSKINSGSSLVIRMKKNPKLVNYLKEWAGKSTKLVAFKLTSNASMNQRITAVKKIFNLEESTPQIKKSSIDEPAHTKNVSTDPVNTLSNSEIISKRNEFSPDFVVSNDLSEISKETHPFKIFAKDLTVAFEGKNNQELAINILNAIK